MTSECPIPYLDVDDAELSDAQLRLKYRPVYIGNTWAVDEDGSWVLPEYSLGWGVAGWMAKYLNSLSGGNAGFELTLEQFRLLLWWYAVDADGNWVYSRGVVQRLKGWGKDPFAAAVALAELCGPVRFDRFDSFGNAVGKRQELAWIDIAAVGKDQANNTAALFPALVSEKLKAECKVVVGKEITYAFGGKASLRIVPNNPRIIEGHRSTFVIMNETHHWVPGKGGSELHLTIEGNVSKIAGARWLAITNAYMPGEGSVAEAIRENWEKVRDGKAEDTGIMYDSVEAPAHVPLSRRQLMIAIDAVRGDSSWMPIAALVNSTLTLSVDPARSRRMYLNQIVADSDSLYGPEQWDRLERKIELAPDDEIVLGFDGGKTDDSTVLVAFRVSDRAAFLLDAWERPDGPEGKSWEINRDEVDSAVRGAFAAYKVLAFFADVALWESYISMWERDFRESLAVKSPMRGGGIAWDMRTNLKASTGIHEVLVRAIFDGHVVHNGDRILRRHVLNVYRRYNDYGLSFGKRSRESPKKVDAYAAMLLAFAALLEYEKKAPAAKKQRSGRGYFL